MAESSTTLIDLMRHGEPVGGRRLRGGRDDALSVKGWRQMRAAVAGHHPWRRIVTSPLCRCRAFAEELSQYHRLALSVEPRLQEIGFGSWEGRDPAHIERREPGKLMRFYRDPSRYAPEGAEPLERFRRRVTDAWNDLLTDHAGEHLLVVTHAGVIRVLLAHVLDIPLRGLFHIAVAYAAITRIRCDQGGGERFSQLLFHDGVL